MSADYFTEGYHQACQDFAAGKEYKPNKLRNLFFLVGGKTVNDEFLSGYRAGWDYCKKLSLQQEAKEMLGLGSQRTGSPNRLDDLNQARHRFGEAPEKEPEY